MGLEASLVCRKQIQVVCAWASRHRPIHYCANEQGGTGSNMEVWIVNSMVLEGG